MKIFLSPKFLEKKSKLSREKDRRIALLISSWEHMTFDKFSESSNVNQLKGIEPLIYTVNIDNNRLFVSPVNERTKDNGIILLDIQEKSARSDYLQIFEGDNLSWEIDAIVADTIQVIVDYEIINDLIASTNACLWYVDDYSLDEIIKHRDGTISAKVYFHLSGKQDEDRVYHGTNINGQATIDIGKEGEVHYVVEEAELEK